MPTRKIKSSPLVMPPRVPPGFGGGAPFGEPQVLDVVVLLMGFPVFLFRNPEISYPLIFVVAHFWPTPSKS